MGKGSKKLYWAGAGAAFLLVVLLALALILPRIVDSGWLKETIQTEFAKQVNGDFNFQTAEVSILPFPSIALQQASLNIPGTAQVNLDTIIVLPNLLSLLMGNIKLDRIVFNKPDFSLPFPRRQEKKTTQKKIFNLSEILEIASSELSPALSAITGLEISVHKGTLRLLAAGEQVFLFENINGSFDVSSENQTLAVSCGSNIWETMELQATIASGFKKGKGTIFLQNVSSKVLTDYFLTDRYPLSEGSFSRLRADFTASPETGLKADIQSSGISFSTRHEDQGTTVKIANIKGKLLLPSDLHYELLGTINNIVLTSEVLPGPLKIESGQVSILPDKIIFENLQADLPNTSLTFSLSYSDKIITLNPAEAVFENKKYSLNGQASLKQKSIFVELDVRADTVELDKILAAVQTDAPEAKEKGAGKALEHAVHGNIRLHADSLLYNDYIWKPVESLITFENDSLDIEFLKAELCDISTPGKISFHDGQIALDFDIHAYGEEFSEVLICLEGGEQQMTGDLNLKVHITGQGTRDTLANSLQGNLQFSAKDGSVYQDAQAAKLLNILNGTSLFKDKIPDLQTV